MVFSSMTFLMVFLPIVLGIYYGTPNRFKNKVLLIASLCFYGFGEPKYIFLLLFSCLINYLFAIAIEVYKKKTWWLVFALVSNVGLLMYFKYIDFIIRNMNALLQSHFDLTYVVLPIGISFFTFQCISYVVDVYRKQVKANRNLLDFATYVTLFPQLIAGPIVRYKDIATQLRARVHTCALFASGIERFIIGLAKKVLLANTMGECITLLSDLPDSILLYWFMAIAFAFQLYFDFSGYSDMAIGLGKMFGFTFLENFNYPYIAKSITEFWRRWHISLSSWFKDYVYIPLKGSRVPVGRLCINILIVWGLTGLWHGAQWNFILWGLYFAVLLIIEKWFLLAWLEKHPIVGHVYTLFVVVIGFVIFQYDVDMLLTQLGNLFALGSVPLMELQVGYYLQSYGVFLLVCSIASTPIGTYVYQTYVKKEGNAKVLSYVEIIGYVLLFMACIAFIVDSSFQPFLYFRF